MRSASRRLTLIANAVAMLVLATGAIRAEASALPPAILRVGGGTIDVEFGDGRFDLPRAALLNHITRAACAVSTYYGHFPAPRNRLLLVPVPGRRGVITGTTWGFGRAHSRILIGEHVTTSDLDSDWITTHEMVHTAFPSVSREHHWIEEGIATYVEPLARSWVGDYPLKKVWADLVLGMPKGKPAPGDEGLDRTHTWGRTYWGGAMFCALADVEIRERTNNKRGLIDALRGILAASGGIESEWPLKRALKAGDDAVGVPVLEQLYTRSGSTPMSPDLAALWARLGVDLNSGHVALDDSARDAAIRQAIGSRPNDAVKDCGTPALSDTRYYDLGNQTPAFLLLDRTRPSALAVADSRQIRARDTVGVKH